MLGSPAETWAIFEKYLLYYLKYVTLLFKNM